MRMLILLLVLFPFQLWGQAGRLVQHSHPQEMLLTGSDLTEDDGVVLVGHGHIGTDCASFVTRLDADGNVSWTREMNVAKVWNGDPTEYAVPTHSNGIACLPGGELVVAGSLGIDPWIDPQVVRVRFFAVMNGNGEEVVTRHHSEWRSDAWGNVLSLDDGNFLLLGYKALVSRYYGELVIFNPSTNEVIAGRRYGRPGEFTWDAFYNATQASNGDLIAVGRDLVLRVTGALDEIWHHCFPEGSGLVDVAESTNGAIWLGFSDHLMRLSEGGTVEWSAALTADFGTILSIKAGPDGSVYVGGNGPDNSVWWGLVDAQGAFVWTERWYGQGLLTDLDEIHVRSDGRLLIVVGEGNMTAVLMADTAGRVDGCSISVPVPLLVPPSLSTVLLPLGSFTAEEPAVAPLTILQQSSNYGGTYELCGTEVGILSGSVYYDVNANGTQDVGESTVPGLPIMIDPQGSTFYNTENGYSIIASFGTYTLNAIQNEAVWGLAEGNGGHLVEVLDADTTVSGLDFGWIPLLDTTIIQFGLTSQPTRCSWPIQQSVYLLNQGTTTADLLVSLVLDPLITFESSVPAADSIVGDTIYWHIDQLAPFGSASVSLLVTMPPFNSIGALLVSTLRTYEVQEDGTTALGSAHVWSSMLTCAFDPNDKLVEPSGMGPVGAIPPETDWLTYTVRFQNTGNDTAFAVVIRDQLSTRLDRSSLEVLATSHELTGLSVTSGGLATFEFDNILLPDSGTNELASHGFVRFRIRLQENLPHGTEIRNDAGIYFDLNPPVVTNTVLNTIQNCALDTFQLELRYENGELLVWSPTSVFLGNYFYTEWYHNGEPVVNNWTWNYTPELPGFYTVVLSTYYTGCVIELGPYQIISTADRDIEMPLVRVLPNPFNDQLQIHYPGTHDRIELVDVNGRVVLSRSTGNATTVYVDRERLASGIYLLRMIQGTTVVATARVVAQ